MDKHIVWDFDEVIANLRDVLCTRVASHMGVKADWRDWHENYQECHKYFSNRGNEVFIQAMLASQAIEFAEPEIGALETFRLTAELGYTNTLVTARGWNPLARDLTLSWLEQYEIKQCINALHIVPALGSKHEIISQLGSVDFFFDDSIGHCTDAVRNCKNVKQVVVVNRPWNVRNVPNDVLEKIARVYDHSDIQTMLLDHSEAPLDFER